MDAAICVKSSKRCSKQQQSLGPTLSFLWIWVITPWSCYSCILVPASWISHCSVHTLALTAWRGTWGQAAEVRTGAGVQGSHRYGEIGSWTRAVSSGLEIMNHCVPPLKVMNGLGMFDLYREILMMVFEVLWSALDVWVITWLIPRPNLRCKKKAPHCVSILMLCQIRSEINMMMMFHSWNLGRHRSSLGNTVVQVEQI